MKRDVIGKIGEDQVSEVLKSIPGCRLLRNLYIPAGGGHTIEIDALLLSKKGLFCIEVKSAKGRVVGSMRLNEWKVHLGGKHGAKPQRYPLYNPIKQNALHVEKLSSFLSLSGRRKPCSVIVFTRAELKQVPKATKDFVILQGTGALHASIMKRLKLRKEIFTNQELNSIIIRLKKAPQPTRSLKKAHVAHVKAAERKRLAEREKRRQARSRKKSSPKSKA